MVEKCLLLVIVYGFILVRDGPRLKKQGGRERIAYGVLMAVSLYLSLDYLLQRGWPNLDDVIRFLLGMPVKSILNAIKVQ